MRAVRARSHQRPHSRRTSALFFRRAFFYAGQLARNSARLTDRATEQNCCRDWREHRSAIMPDRKPRHPFARSANASVDVTRPVAARTSDLAAVAARARHVSARIRNVSAAAARRAGPPATATAIRTGPGQALAAAQRPDPFMASSGGSAFELERHRDPPPASGALTLRTSLPRIKLAAGPVMLGVCTEREKGGPRPPLCVHRNSNLSARPSRRGDCRPCRRRPCWISPAKGGRRHRRRGVPRGWRSP